IDGNLLPLIVATTLFAVAAAGLPEEKRRTLTDLADVATAALIRIVWWVLLLAPLGIFALVAGAVAQFGLSLVKTMAVFVLAVVAGLGVFIAGVLLPAIALIARVRVSRFLEVAWPSLALAFSTTSSLAALPTWLAAAFSATGLPLAGLTLLIGLDRIPDMFRTMTNVMGSLSGAAVVAAQDGDSISTAA